MENNYLDLKNENIKVVKPVISFPEYKKLMKEGKEVAEFIESIELDDSNIKQVKKVLASANKAIKELNDRRIAIKKEILEPYEVFNSQIKDIEKIVKDADSKLRNEVRKLEEIERENKKSQIKDLWNKRIGQYQYAKLMEFDDFLDNKHLNKSISMKSVEEDMVNKLESFERDLEILSKRDDKKDGISLYKEFKDLGIVLQILKEKEEEIKRQKEVLKEIEVNQEETFIFKIVGKKDKNFAEMLLKENDIEYKLEEI